MIFPDRSSEGRYRILWRPSEGFQPNSKSKMKALKHEKRSYLRAHTSVRADMYPHSFNFSRSFFWHQIQPISISWDALFKLIKHTYINSNVQFAPLSPTCLLQVFFNLSFFLFVCRYTTAGLRSRSHLRLRLYKLWQNSNIPGKKFAIVGEINWLPKKI